MFAEFLQNSDRFIATDKETDAVVVPAFRVQLNRFADADEELVEGPSERDVVVPCGPGDELVFLRHAVPVHKNVAGVTVIGLGDLEHEVHLGPGLDVEILLICLGVVIQDRLPGFGEPLLDALRVDTVRLRVVADVVNDEIVVLPGHGVHLREFEEFFALVVR